MTKLEHRCVHCGVGIFNVTKEPCKKNRGRHEWRVMSVPFQETADEMNLGALVQNFIHDL